jgi:DNA-binding beta-propeller fold protein YncE
MFRKGSFLAGFWVTVPWLVAAAVALSCTFVPSPSAFIDGRVLDAADGGSAVARLAAKLPKRLLSLGPLQAFDIHHLEVRLTRVESSTPADLATFQVPVAELSQTVYIRNLRAGVPYRVAARAHGRPGDGDEHLLSDPDDEASTTLVVGRDQGVETTVLEVRLRARPGLLLTRLAGRGTAGDEDGQGVRAAFREPVGLAVDGVGRLYVADRAAHRIRVVDASGEVRTLAGSLPGDVDGPGRAAQFNSPHGLAVDRLGGVLVADAGNNRVRRISPLGTVTTVAGGAAGHSDGSARLATFRAPEAVAVGENGEFWVADTGNHCIRRIGADSTVVTVAGGAAGFADGTGDDARFRSPAGLAWDRANTLFVADSGNNALRALNTRTGRVTTLGLERPDGTVDGGVPLSAPWGLAWDPSGSLYVTEPARHRVWRVSARGGGVALVGFAEGVADGTVATAGLSGPRGLAWDPRGRLYIADTGNRVLRLLQ